MAIELVSLRFGRENDPGSPVAPLAMDFGVRRDAVREWTPQERSTLAVMAALLPNDPVVVLAKFRRTAGEQHFHVEATPSPGTPFRIRRTPLGFGDDDVIVRELQVIPFQPDEVASLPFTLTWTITPRQATPSQFTTSHLMHVMLFPPGDPWSADFRDSHRWVWTEVLDLACHWAEGAKTLDEIADRITAKVNELGTLPEQQGGLRYDSAPHYTITNQFQCQEFIEHVKSGGRMSMVNCTDLATIVSTFANALGCRLVQSQCSKGTTVSVELIGGASPSVSTFEFHEVAWDGATLGTDRVWDACVRFSSGAPRALPFPRYAQELYGAPTAVAPAGPVYTSNRPLFARAAQPLSAKAETIVQTRQPAVASAEKSAPLPALVETLRFAICELNEWPKVAPVYQDENRWQQEWRGPEGSRAIFTLSTFRDAEQARHFLRAEVATVSEPVRPVPALPGAAFLSPRGTLILYQYGSLVLIGRVHIGSFDLEGMLRSLIPGLPV